MASQDRVARRHGRSCHWVRHPLISLSHCFGSQEPLPMQAWPCLVQLEQCHIALQYLKATAWGPYRITQPVWQEGMGDPVTQYASFAMYVRPRCSTISGIRCSGTVTKCNAPMALSPPVSQPLHLSNCCVLHTTVALHGVWCVYLSAPADGHRSQL